MKVGIIGLGFRLGYLGYVFQASTKPSRSRDMLIPNQPALPRLAKRHFRRQGLRQA